VNDASDDETLEHPVVITSLFDAVLEASHSYVFPAVVVERRQDCEQSLETI